MNKRAIFTLLTIALTAPFVCLADSDYPVKPVPFTDVHFTDGLLHDRQEVNTKVTMPFALRQLESSGRLRNFDLAADTMKRRAEGDTTFQHRPPTQYPFDDTDVYKALEGAAFCLSVQPDPELQKELEKMIARIAAAQEPDGYLYTFRTMHPDFPGHDFVGQERWVKATSVSHEFYNAGHLYEAGTAYMQATGCSSLLDISLKNAELIHRDFGNGQDTIVPGHQVIEMGLAKLYRQTGDSRWLDLAQIFLESRGRKPGVRGVQNHLPVVDQREAVGHAVRANYQYSGMADIAALKNDARYLEAIHALWDNVVGKKLHITGGVGARYAGEAYGDNYELPSRCYNETCAAIAFLYWNHRMFLLEGDGKYMDVFERTLYNGFLSGVSLSGDRFFYPNTLEYDGQETNNHGHAGRAPWFGCACCPPNLMRMMASLSGYAYAVRDEKLYVNLYAQGDAQAEVQGNAVKVTQETEYPWKGGIKLTVEPAAASDFTLCLRIPGWVRGKPVPTDLYAYQDPTPATYRIQVNGEPIQPRVESGFAMISRTWKAGDVVELNLSMPVRRVVGNPKVEAIRDQVALERGPIVYAFEGIDNDDSVFDIALTSDAQVTPAHKPELLGGATLLNVTGAQRVTLQKNGELTVEPSDAVAIPYALWNNRGLSPMGVWLGRDAEHVRPTTFPTAASTAKLSVSFARHGMHPARINDRQMPRNATDRSLPNFDFWPHKGGTEWVTYDFEKSIKVNGVTVSWFDDTGRGECRLPKSWRVLYKDKNGSWAPVQEATKYHVRKAEPVTVTFKPICTQALRLEVELEDDFSAGLYEWEVSTEE